MLISERLPWLQFSSTRVAWLAFLSLSKLKTDSLRQVGSFSGLAVWQSLDKLPCAVGCGISASPWFEAIGTTG